MHWRYKFLAVDTIIATLVVILTGALLVHTSSRIAQESLKGNLLGQLLSLGEHRFIIESHGNCVGKFTQRLEDENDLLNFTGEGQLRVSLHGDTKETKLNVLASFNMLGQMGAGGFLLEGQGFVVRVTFQEIDPIQIVVHVESAGQQFERKLQIPGPIELQRVGLRSYRLRHGRFHLLEGGGAGMVSSFLSDKLQLASKEAAPQACSAGLTPLDLTPVSDSLLRLASGMSLFTQGLQ